MSDSLTKYWKAIGKDLFVLRAEGLEDFRAVVGSKTSRATNLDLKADLDRDGVEKFLSLNLAGYGHASIGEMSFPTIHHRGFGWVGAWLMEDDPLFVGQEVSTRAVDMRKLPEGNKMCYDAPSFLQNHHDLFWNIFNELNEKNSETKGYKFDNIRWAMPGSTKVGVTYMMNARAAMRHMERLASIPFMEKCVENFKLGVRECSPFVFDALDKGKRSMYNRWSKLDVVKVKENSLDFSNSIKIECLRDLNSIDIYKNAKTYRARGERDYLDPDFKVITPFKLTMICSVAAARDWHRHRPVMPWQIRMVTNEDGSPFIAPWYDISGYESDVKRDLKESFDNSKDLLNSNGDKFQALYSMPYGALVEIECNGSLPDILYMLELRHGAGGANFEYSMHAREGLKQLCDILGKDFTNYHSLDRTLK